MNTKIYTDIDACGALIRDGELVAFPTETVYGLGANALDANAVAKIFAVKNRPQDNPLIAHIADLAMLPMCAREIPPIAKKLMERFFPGPLTIVLPKADGIASAVTAGGDTVAVRCPDHPVARALIKAAGVPIVAPSANLSGRPSPTTMEAVLEDLDGKIAAVLDGGACAVGVESTVALPEGDGVRILRPGAVTRQMLCEIAPRVILDENILHPVQAGAKVLSPGMKHRHYAPKAPLTIVTGDPERVLAFLRAHRDESTGILCFEGEMTGARVLTYGRADDAATQARALFAALRTFDTLGVTRIYARAPEPDGVGLAVYNRLLRAAQFQIVEV